MNHDKLRRAAEQIVAGYEEVCRVMTPHVPCNPADSTDKAVILAVAYLADLLPCGHHASLLESSVESDFKFCNLCDARERLRDAIEMEKHNHGTTADEAWMHAACLTIAETGQKWGENVKPSPAMDTVYRLKLRHDNLMAAAREARAALYGCREVLGSVANIQHAIDLLNKATSGLNYVQKPHDWCADPACEICAKEIRPYTETPNA